ncbi:MAG: carboxymethylenebutenolidase [Anaerolineaceae bacterium]|nr:carboxymethylenebutenolidase [Anaerolineaceae bacterium]
MDITTQTVNIPNGTPNLSGYFVYPSGEAKFPGVVVIHEAYGLNDNIKDITRRFAEAGYAALAVDLFAGRNQMICMFRFFTNMLLFDSLNHSGIRDLKTSLDWLEKHSKVEGGKIGAIGFCMGGSFAISWACSDSRLNVIAPFYSMNPRPLGAVERACPVVGSFPENDFSKNGGIKLEAELTKHNIPHDIKIYPDSKHSFFNSPRDVKEQAAADDSWSRILTFFREHIGG